MYLGQIQYTPESIVFIPGSTDVDPELRSILQKGAAAFGNVLLGPPPPPPPPPPGVSGYGTFFASWTPLLVIGGLVVLVMVARGGKRR